MKILVTGSSGLVGSALVPALLAEHHEVVRLVRHRRTAPHFFTWSPDAGEIDPKAFEGVDAVIHLAGENIAAGRWTAEVKQKIRQSRINGTSLLAKHIAELENPPKVFIVASAIGYYGNRGDEVLTEVSDGGKDFLTDVCREWEAAADPARAKGVRVVHTRFGIILSRKGGALAKMLPLFQLGGGGNLGNGKQWMSWIDLDDAVGAIRHVLKTDSIHGPVNVVAPNPVTNADFTRTLGKVLSRPALFPAPALALKAILGEMADALLLASQRVEPVRLNETGYAFKYPLLEPALSHQLDV